MVEEIKKRLKIVVGTNSLTESQYPAYSNHCQFWFRLGRSYPDIDFIFMNPSRMSIDRMRNATVSAALAAEADYILFLDDDVLINPFKGLRQLLDCNADCAAGKVVIRGYPFDYMIFKWGGPKEARGLKPMKKLPTSGILPFDAVGFSFCLLKIDIFYRLSEPWFVTGINHTEDIYFCNKARDLNPKFSIKVNCECDCGHILWPEVMDSTNRAEYAKYFEATNPGSKEVISTKTVKAQNWRSKKYLAQVKELTHAAKA